ncbi:hypothetical protein ACZ90_28225 [Streptomyces albus subsp. albus]|nr:hypothetical protein ACZ90_28225 [Streptomyces albus subsp. albus]
MGHGPGLAPARNAYEVSVQHSQRLGAAALRAGSPLRAHTTAPTGPTGRGGPPARDSRRNTMGYLAFVQLQGPRYLEYAGARLHGDDSARVAVHATLSLIARRWGELLCEPRPGAEAWSHLRDRVGAMSRDGWSRNAEVDRLYGSLPADAADMVVLRCLLGMSEQATADVMGVDPPTVAAGLRAAGRRLPPGAFDRYAGGISRR